MHLPFNNIFYFNKCASAVSGNSFSRGKKISHGLGTYTFVQPDLEKKKQNRGLFRSVPFPETLTCDLRIIIFRRRVSRRWESLCNNRPST